jgi:ribosome-binding ATPase YchF (GTP1/OBG family)
MYTQVREWLFPDEEGIVAVAGRLDIEFHRYFQFALVVTYDDLHQVDGDMLDIRSENKLQQQGKAYLIGDGDIIDCSECKPGKRRLTR